MDVTRVSKDLPEQTRRGTGGCAMDEAETVHPAWAEIDLERLERNHHEVLRRIGPDIKLIASIKANAYGHGAVPVAKALVARGVYGLATGSFEEAAALRESGIDTKILMLATYLPEGIPELLRYDLIPTVYNMELASAVSQAASETASIFIKVDAGLGRIGVPLVEAADFIRRAAELPRVHVEGVYTHLPFFDEAGREWARERLLAFDGLIDDLSRSGVEIPITQARASADLVVGLEDKCNAVCVGHALYGLAPITPELWDADAFKPVIKSIKTRLIHVVRQRAGSAIWVGGRYLLNKAKVMGVAPLGLSNGARNAVEGRQAFVLIRGRRVPVLGVSLEQMVLDLDGIDGAELGDEVVLLGEDGDERIAIEELAQWSGLSPLEVLVTFNGRLSHRYHNRADDIWTRFATDDRPVAGGLEA
jgi:alanine racemase